MQQKSPEGYRNLLAYKKAQELQYFTNNFVNFLPKTKTFFDLADQMARSGRSGGKNIVEGWKRNSTKEHFEFLGFSIGAVEELKDDAADIVCGVYPSLIGVKGIMGEKGIKREVLDKLQFYPLPVNLSPAVELFLRAKEVNFLLYKLQKSLDQKMDLEKTKPANERFKNYFNSQKKVDAEYNEYLKSTGLVRLLDGRFITKQEWEKLGKPEVL